MRRCGLSHGDHCFSKCGLWDNWAVTETWIPDFPIRPARSESPVDVAQDSAFYQNVPGSPRYTSGFEKEAWLEAKAQHTKRLRSECFRLRELRGPHCSFSLYDLVKI